MQLQLVAPACANRNTNAVPGLFIQPKLTIHQPGDAFEQEADAMADSAMRMPHPGIQLKPMLTSPIQRKCAHCEEEEKKLQRKEINGEATTVENNVANYVGSLNGGGQSLPEETRNFYEPRFGYDFGNVRIHQDAVAAKSAQSINALAYTSGNNIVFNNGQYAPGANSGKRLLAHELAHVVQQQSMPLRAVMRQSDKKEEQDGAIIEEIKKNPLFKKLPKPAQDKIIEELESVPEKIAQEIADRIIDSLSIDGELKKGLKKAVEAIIEKLKGKPPKFSPCDIPGFHPGGSSQFKGMCCTESTENDRVCCPPARMATTERRCCPKDTVVSEGKCVNPNDLPPLPKKICLDGRPPTFSGECCTPEQINLGTLCADKPIIPPPPPQPQLTIEKKPAIAFKKDAPQTWLAPAASFNASLTTQGKAAFEGLVAFLMQSPEPKIQMQGHASSEKPKGDPNYNQRLTDRRVKLIMGELKKKGIAANRFANVPGDADAAGCVELSPGVLSCGDLQAQGAVEAGDRNVTVTVFEIK